ncbi:MAG: hypothetical protein J7L11_05790 [Thermoprotei archaeon]|nr:hypothetical protein [Thermoprotei archaeon]
MSRMSAKARKSLTLAKLLAHMAGGLSQNELLQRASVKRATGYGLLQLLRSYNVIRLRKIPDRRGFRLEPVPLYYQGLGRVMLKFLTEWDFLLKDLGSEKVKLGHLPLLLAAMMEIALTAYNQEITLSLKEAENIAMNSLAPVISALNKLLEAEELARVRLRYEEAPEHVRKLIDELYAKLSKAPRKEP